MFGDLKLELWWNLKVPHALGGPNPPSKPQIQITNIKF
jgi:hypothetical protein